MEVARDETPVLSSDLISRARDPVVWSPPAPSPFYSITPYLYLVTARVT
jgi:hypothetical protein